MKKNTYFIAGKRIEVLLKETKNKSQNIIVKYLNDRTIIERKRIMLKDNTVYQETIVKKIFSRTEENPCNSIELILPNTTKYNIQLINFFKLFVEKIPGVINNSTVNQVKLIFFDNNYFNRFVKSFEPLLINLSSKTFKNPYPAVDIIIEKSKGVVLVYRKNFPQGWAMPGGFINYGESAEQAAIREAREETGLDIENLKFFGVFSEPGRDPRFHTISIVYSAKGKGRIKPGDDASKVKIFSKNNLPKDIAFDHRKILFQFFEKQGMKL